MVGRWSGDLRLSRVVDAALRKGRNTDAG